MKSSASPVLRTARPTPPRERSDSSSDSRRRPYSSWNEAQTETLWEKVNGEEGAGVAISFILHALLLALLAIPVWRTLKDEASLTTVVQSPTDEDVVITAPIDTEVALPAPDSAGDDQLKSQLLEMTNLPADLVDPDLPVSSLTTLLGDHGEEGEEGTGVGGIRLAEPKTAVRAGSFSAWPWPIVARRFQLGEVHGKPGSFPRVGQAYHIVIRIRLPESTHKLALDDLSGEIIGTDGYKQRIPDDAWIENGEGHLVRVSRGDLIPIVEGVAEILIRVPGAQLALVKDTIKIHSRLLKEDQTLELTFRGRP